MTTPRDLLIVAMDLASSRPVERGDLSLGLAGAELIDLLGAQAVALDADRLVPGSGSGVDDPLLDEVASSLAGQVPYTSIGDWLWQRGRGLSAVYLAALEADGQLVRERRRRWLFFRASQLALADSPARRLAASRWAAGEPVLDALATAVGIRDRRPGDFPIVADDAVMRVLIALDDALRELALERQRRGRRREDAAIDNVQRGY